MSGDSPDPSTSSRGLFGISEGAASAALLVLAALFVGQGMWPEVRAGGLQFSDVTLHLGVLRQLDQALSSSGSLRSLFDFWFDASPFGYPLFRVYQHIPHLLMYGFYRICLREIPLELCVSLCTIFAAMLLPVSFYFSARLLGISKLESAAAGVFSVLVSEEAGYGLGLQNFMWGTNGIITQLWAALFMVPALALALRFMRTGKGLGWALLFCFLAIGSHILSGYVLGLSLGAVILTRWWRERADRKRLLSRAGAYFLGMAVVTAHQWVFILMDAPYIHRSVHEFPWKYASRGISWALSNFVHGNLFDQGRWPILSGFLGLGVLAVLGITLPRTPWLQRKAKSSCAGSPPVLVLSDGEGLVLFLVWFSLLCGYEVWGWVFQNLPLLSSMHMHRFIIGVQIFGILLAARGAGLVFRWSSYPVFGAVILVLLLIPCVSERQERFRQSAKWSAQAREAFALDQGLQGLEQELKSLPRGRIHSGMNGNWGSEMSIAGWLPFYHRLVSDGLPALGMLFHAMSLTGDVLFEFNPFRESDYRLFALRYTAAPRSKNLPAFLFDRKIVGNYQLATYPQANLLSVEDVLFEGWGDPAESAKFMAWWVRSDFASRHLFGRILPHGPEGKLFGVPFASQALTLQPLPGEPGQVLSEGAWSADHLEGQVELKRDAAIVFKVGFHPNWEARIDGAPVATEWVTPGFIAVPGAAGKHHVEFQYQPSALKPWLFLLALLTSGGLITKERSSEQALLEKQEESTSLELPR